MLLPSSEREPDFFYIFCGTAIKHQVKGGQNPLSFNYLPKSDSLLHHMYSHARFIAAETQ